jgi:flagellin-like hook-associated protein FlgL
VAEHEESRREKKMKRPGSFGLMALVVGLSLWAVSVVSAADKVISYKGDTFNVENVTKVSSRVEGQAGEEAIVGIRSLNKKQFNSYVDKAGSVVVTTFIEFDSDELVYRKVGVTKYGDLQNVIDQLDKAMKQITKFMGRKKGGVLKLK